MQDCMRADKAKEITQMIALARHLVRMGNSQFCAAGR